MYDCLDRSDEIPFNIVKEDFWFAINLTPCNVSITTTRIVSGYECTRNNVTKCVTGWCNVNYGHVETCDEIDGRSIVDKTLCRNYTFWQNEPCQIRNFQNDPYYVRCQGRSSGQCVAGKIVFLVIFNN